MIPGAGLSLGEATLTFPVTAVLMARWLGRGQVNFLVLVVLKDVGPIISEHTDVVQVHLAKRRDLAKEVLPTLLQIKATVQKHGVDEGRLSQVAEVGGHGEIGQHRQDRAPRRGRHRGRRRWTGGNSDKGRASGGGHARGTSDDKGGGRHAGNVWKEDKRKAKGSKARRHRRSLSQSLRKIQRKPVLLHAKGQPAHPAERTQGERQGTRR